MQRFDLSPITQITRTPQGGVKVPASVTRVGVFTYTDAAGNPRREYRPAEEVFSADSLDSLRGAPVVVGHPAVITPSNYSKFAVGHVGDDVIPRGDFVATTLRVQDASASAAVAETKTLVEVSCGYSVILDSTPGEFNGQAYDVVQRNIRYNHVGLGPKNWGRLGNDVKIHLDGQDDGAACTYLDDAASYVPIMPTQEELDAARKDAANHRADAATLRTDIDNARKDVAEAKARFDKLSGERDALAQNLADITASIPARVDSRISLVAKCKALAGDKAIITGSDMELMIGALKTVQPSISFDGKSVDYISGMFDVACSTPKTAVNPGQVTDSNPARDPVEKARLDMLERHSKAAL